MKTLKIILKLIIIISILIVPFTISYAEEKVNEIISDTENDSSIDIQYEYDESTNQVTAKIISEIELKDTKQSWKLSEDKKVYTRTYTENTTYRTTFEDINGNVIEVEIDITQIKPAKIDINYIYDEKTNTVKTEIKSNTELKHTKLSWELSEDKKVYTRVYYENTIYGTTFEDINGNIIETEIRITEVRNAKIEVDPIYDENTNTVTVEVKSDIELKATKKSWTLSEDKKTYSRVYTENTTYGTSVEDIYGNVIEFEVKVTQIDTKGPKIQLEYKYNEDDTVTIYMKSNEKLGETKPTWKLSEDKLTYEKTYSEKQEYSTNVEDTHGNITNVSIKLKKKKVDQEQKDGSKISVRYIYTSYDNVIVEMVSSVRMENTKPTWELSEDGYRYTKTFYGDTKYTTGIQDINGLQKDVEINVDLFYKIINEKGTYGISGAWIHGKPGGSELEYYRFGNGENVLFATFCVHGYEDSWEKDGTLLVDTANEFYNKLLKDEDVDLAKKWTIYIFKEVNPDGRRLGNTNNGAGRTTLYSKLGQGMDINRCWQTGDSYMRFTDSRNYNGTEGFQAYEAEALKNFFLKHKSKNGQTVLIDLHGWEDQLIGDEEICKYYKEQYPSCSTRNYGKYGTQYIITWARQNLGAKVALVELPLAENREQADEMKLSNKYINATLNMLKEF